MIYNNFDVALKGIFVCFSTTISKSGGFSQQIEPKHLRSVPLQLNGRCAT